MKFTAREDIEAPIDYVFDQVTDFATFERSIMRRGGDVERLTGDGTPELGMSWQMKFQMRGKERTVKAELTQLDAPNSLTIDVTSPNADGEMVVELVALSRARTRLIVTASAVAKTVPAKLLFQTMRFARSKTDARFKGMVTNFAEDVEKRHLG